MPSTHKEEVLLPYEDDHFVMATHVKGENKVCLAVHRYTTVFQNPRVLQWFEMENYFWIH